jgi:hypothetical protein
MSLGFENFEERESVFGEANLENRLSVNSKNRLWIRASSKFSGFVMSFSSQGRRGLPFQAPCQMPRPGALRRIPDTGGGFALACEGHKLRRSAQAALFALSLAKKLDFEPFVLRKMLSRGSKTGTSPKSL